MSEHDPDRHGRGARGPLPDPWHAWLQGRERRTLHLPDYRQAAVLVALTDERDPRVLLTVRSPDLPTHQGQISFPGGRIEPGEGIVDAALREAWEEVGLDRSAVHVLGLLDDAFTPIGYHVTPVLARVPPAYPYRPHAGEVALVIEPTLRELRSLSPVRERRTLPSGETRTMYRYPWNGHDIWGMTAMILHDLVHSDVED